MGAKPGRMKGNEQKAKYEEAEGKHGKPGGAEVEKQGSESGEAAPEKQLRGGTGKRRKGRTEG